MAKVGYLSILVGILTIICYSLYMFLIALEVSFVIKIAILLIVLGIFIVIVKQISDKKTEKKEEDDYKNY